MHYTTRLIFLAALCGLTAHAQIIKSNVFTREDLTSAANKAVARELIGLFEWTTNSVPAYTGNHSSEAALDVDDVVGDAGVRFKYGTNEYMLMLYGTNLNLVSALDGSTPAYVASPGEAAMLNYKSLTNLFVMKTNDYGHLTLLTADPTETISAAETRIYSKIGQKSRATLFGQTLSGSTNLAAEVVMVGPDAVATVDTIILGTTNIVESIAGKQPADAQLDEWASVSTNSVTALGVGTLTATTLDGTAVTADSVIATNLTAVVDTIAEMEAWTNTATKTLVVNDANRGGTFSYQTSGTPDGGLVFAATGITTGAWVRVSDKSAGVDLRNWGAYTQANFETAVAALAAVKTPLLLSSNIVLDDVALPANAYVKGLDATISSTAAKSAFTIAGTGTNIVLQDLAFSGGGGSSAGVPCAVRVAAADISGFRMLGCSVTGYAYGAMWVDGETPEVSADDVAIEGCSFEGGTCGLVFDGNTNIVVFTNVRVKDCSFTSHGQFGLFASHTRNAWITGCSFSNTPTNDASYAGHAVYLSTYTDGITVSGCKFDTIAKCNFDDTACVHAYTSTTATAAKPRNITIDGNVMQSYQNGVLLSSGINNVSIVNNAFNTPTSKALYLYGPNTVTVSGNNFGSRTNTSLTKYWLYVSQGSANVSVMANTVANLSAYATLASNLQVSGNTVNVDLDSDAAESAYLFTLTTVTNTAVTGNAVTIREPTSGSTVQGMQVTGTANKRLTVADNSFVADPSQGYGYGLKMPTSIIGDSELHVTGNRVEGWSYPIYVSGTYSRAWNNRTNATQVPMTYYDGTAWQTLETKRRSAVTTSAASFAGEMLSAEASACSHSGWSYLDSSYFTTNGTTIAYTNAYPAAVIGTNTMQTSLRSTLVPNRVYDVSFTLTGACTITNDVSKPDPPIVYVELGGNRIGQLATTTSSFSTTARCGSGTNLIIYFGVSSTNQEIRIAFDTISIVPWATGDLIHSHDYDAATLVSSAGAAPYFEFSAAGVNAATANVKTNIMALSTATVTDAPERIAQVVTTDNGGNWTMRGRVFATGADDYALSLTYIDPTLTTNIVTTTTDLARWYWANAGYIYFGADVDEAEGDVTHSMTTVEFKP